jgi:chromosome segregation ATPase
MGTKADIASMEEKLSKMDEIFSDYYDALWRLNDNLKEAQARVAAVESKIENLENKTANQLDREVPGWRAIIASRQVEA